MKIPPLPLVCLLVWLVVFQGEPPGQAQTADDMWQDADEASAVAARRGVVSERTVVPKTYRTVRLNWTVFRKALATLELAKGNTAEITLPLPNGAFARFSVSESPLMEPKLAAKFPQLKTYTGQGIDDPRLTVRFDQTVHGFHALIFTPTGSIYIDPYWRNETETYVAYYRREFKDPTRSLSCTTRAPLEPRVAARSAQRPTGSQLRTYRLAVAATAEYVQAAGGGTVNGALSAILTTVNRVSAVYERDLCIRLKLVDGEDKLIFLNAATDGYSNLDGDAMLGQNQTKIDSIIGDANYDIGHVFSTGGGGVAGLGVVGLKRQKAQGVTGSDNPVGDPYDIDYVAHEMGHQFGADHPFNATSGSCSGGNRNGPTAYEPGSGTTIMAYAGICAPQDLAPNSDDYFHTTSYEEIDGFISSIGGVGVTTATGNSVPTIAPLTNRVIPAETPFALTASATDPDPLDELTYCWEQFDRGPAQNPTIAPRDNGSSPLFRSFSPSRSRTRLFPSLTYILHNANVPPASVGNFASGEFLPTTSRTMTFRVTVRDNHPGGGASNFAAMTVTSTDTAGPFAITSHNSATTFAGGSVQTIKWAVANTAAAPVSCANVKISLSTDGGETWPFVLASSTANDGSATVTIPNTANVATTQGRFKVEAVGNIFFDVNGADLTITSTNIAPKLSVTGNVTVKRGTPTSTSAIVATVSDTNTPLTATLVNVPADATVTAAIAGGKVTVSARADSQLVTTNTSRTYPIKLVVTDSLGSIASDSFNLIVQPNPAPTLGNYADQTMTNGASLLVQPSAPPADANNNLASNSVSPGTLPGGGTLTIQNNGVVTITTVQGTTPGTYVIRATAQDAAGAAVVKSFNLTVLNSNVMIVAGTASAPISENCVPANAAVDPAEKVTVNFSLRNTGGGPSTNLVATLRNSTGVTPLTISQNYGAIPAMSSASRPFTFTASGACGSTINATFHLQDGANDLGTVVFPIRLGNAKNNPGITQNFDGLTAPALPSGWTSNVATGPSSPWVTSSTTPDSPPNEVSATTARTVCDNRLLSPSFPVNSTSAQVSFRHRWRLEDTYDGGVLEISINSAPFTDILAAGGSFETGGYTGTIETGYSSPIAGRRAWTGSANADYTKTAVNLPAAAAGQDVRLRFRLASDGSTSVTGAIWRIDSISMTDTSYACCGAAPVFTSVLPPASALEGTPYSHRFATTGTPPPTFALTKGPLPPGLSLSSGLLSGTPTTPGIYPNLTVTAINGLSPSDSQTFSITITDTFERAMVRLGFTGANADPAADPDGDGLSNLYEYGLQTPPNLPNSNGLPIVTGKLYNGTEFLSMTFTRKTTATDLTYVVQVSDDLATWTDVASSVGGKIAKGPGFVRETGSGATRTVEVRDTISAPQRSIRLQIFRTANP